MRQPSQLLASETVIEMSPIDIKSIYHTDIITIPEKVISHPKPGIMSVSTRCLENMNEDVFYIFFPTSHGAHCHRNHAHGARRMGNSPQLPAAHLSC